MEDTARGNALLIDERWPEAIEAYEVAKTTVAEAAANIVLALLKSGAWSEALQAGESARSLHPHDPLVSLRYGQALFHLDRFAEALEVFRTVPDLSRSFVQKCERELKRSENVGSKTTGEKYTWFQTDSHVVLELPVKVASEAQCRVESDEYRIEVSAVTTSNEEYHITIPLLQAIDPSATSTKATRSHLDVTLKKKSQANWVAVEPAQLQQPLKYPSSKKKDWSQVDHEIEKELKAEKPQGDEALMSLFRQIYENGNESTRRAMIKSFQTSSGTVLSTNWDEVAAKDYEGKDRPSPPEGQSWAPKE